MIIGMLIGIIIVLLTTIVFLLGYNVGKSHKAEPSKVDEETARRIKEMQEGWQNIFNYDINQALGLRGVRHE